MGFHRKPAVFGGGSGSAKSGQWRALATAVGDGGATQQAAAAVAQARCSDGDARGDEERGRRGAPGGAIYRRGRRGLPWARGSDGVAEPDSGKSPGRAREEGGGGDLGRLGWLGWAGPVRKKRVFLNIFCTDNKNTNKHK